MLRTALLLFLASTAATFAQTDDILANAGKFRPKITLTDNYSERVLQEVDGDTVFRSVVPNSERISVNVTANLDGIDPGVIDETTLVEISIGNFDHSASLGDAPDYKPGTKHVTFPLTKEVFNANGDSHDVTVGSVVYAWSAKTLTVTVMCTDIDGAGVSDVAASDYVGLADPGKTLAIVNDPIDVLVSFGDASGGRTAYLRGLTRTVTQNFGSVALGTDESLDVSTVQITGAADTDGPKVNANFPAKPNTLNKIDVTGGAWDITDVSLDSVTVNGVAITPANVFITDPEGDGTWAWSVAGIVLKKGKNDIAITFSDVDGNETKVMRSYTLLK